METTRIAYQDRFDPHYLSILKGHLSIEHLKETALNEEKEINGITYKKCISIEFAGLAATTLFYSNPESPNITKENLDLRKEIREIFRNIFTAVNVNELNKLGFYLRAKFCFSYLYSDFPICLMKAELPEVWEFQANKPVEEFYINFPVTRGEFKRAIIKNSQTHSLEMIAGILAANKELIFLGEKEKHVNTIQVRFSSIPSPVCVLIINDTAFCDPYLYSMQGIDRQLEFTYPVVILEKKGKETSKGFDSIKRHMNYLWRHDLTLFCKDATFFEPDKISELDKIRTPEMIIGSKGTKWGHKAKRIWQRIQEKQNLEAMTPEIEGKISLWKANLTEKFMACTRKLKSQNDPSENEFFLTVGMRREFFYFRLELKKTNTVFEYLHADWSILFCVLAHYSFAKVSGEVPVLHKNCLLGQSRLRQQIEKQLNQCDLNQTKSGTLYVDELFPKNAIFDLNIPVNCIEFDETEKEKIERATYSTRIEIEDKKLRKRKDKYERTDHEELSCLLYLELPE